MDDEAGIVDERRYNEFENRKKEFKELKKALKKGLSKDSAAGV